MSNKTLEQIVDSISAKIIALKEYYEVSNIFMVAYGVLAGTTLNDLFHVQGWTQALFLLSCATLGFFYLDYRLTCLRKEILGNNKD